MNFTKYNSITNVSVDAITYTKINISESLWTVTEKVHGANTSLVTNGKNITFAKRTAPVGEAEDFFGYNQNNFDKFLIKEKIINLFNKAKEVAPDIEVLTVYGELFGGSYSHPDVEKVANACRVQKGIQYAPFNSFYAFDIKINGNFISTDLCNALLEDVGIFYAKSLFEGTLDECLVYPNIFESTIPKQLNLPEITNNVCEGVIIKPFNPCFFASGKRVIFKNKNEKWKEVSSKPERAKVIVNVPEYLSSIYEDSCRYITENRLKNTISKVGFATFEKFNVLNGMFVQDILQDFSEDNKEYSNLKRKEQKIINKLVGKQAVQLLKDYLYKEK